MSDDLDPTGSDDVEAHKKRFFVAEDAEAPADIDVLPKSDDKENEEPDVEAHRKKFFG